MSQSIFLNGGYSSTDKVPGPYGEVAPASGSLSAASIPLRVLCVGLKTSDGTATVDTDVEEMFSEDDGVTLFGQRSQLRRMARALFAQGEDIEVYGIAVAEPSSSPVAAFVTVTFTVGTAWTSTLTYTATVCGEDVTIGIPVGATPTQIAAAFVLAINAVTWLPATATSAVGVVTITVANLGTTGNAYFYNEDKSLAAGLTTAIAGGTAIPGSGTPFSGGVGTESVVNALATIYSTQYDRIVIGQVDATNLALWKTQLAAQAMPIENHRQHAITGTNGAYAAATTTATTTLNVSRIQLLQLQNCENPGWEFAAAFAAIRTANEQDDPDAAFDGQALVGIRPQRNRADRPSHSQQVALLNNGVTPLNSTDDGSVLVIRSITTRSLNGSIPDYRQLDTSQAVVPDFVLLTLQLFWLTVFLPANPRVRDNPSATEPPLGAGIATPDDWTRAVTGILLALAAEDEPILIEVAQNLPASTWNDVGQNIDNVCPVVVAPNQHKIGISVRPIAA